MNKPLLYLAVALMGFFPSLSFGADVAAPKPQAEFAGRFTEAQRAEIEDIVKTYLTEKHPEVIGMGLQNLQKREQEASDTKMKAKIMVEKDRLFNDPASPSIGDPKAKVTVVEFFDYQCGYCKVAEPTLERLMNENKDVRFVFKNFPILGPVSLESAKASLASVRQNKFLAFHEALMNRKDRQSSEGIYEVAKQVGLDVEKLKKDMADKPVVDAVEANLKLGQDIGVRGTPFFLVNNTALPGAVEYDQFQKIIAEARGK